MGGMGEEEIVIMYHYIEDKVFLKDMKYLCSNIINQLVQLINNDSLMEVKAHLVGSGAKNLITQNSNEPIDLDYNLMIIDSEININNCREIGDAAPYFRYRFYMPAPGSPRRCYARSFAVVAQSYLSR